jgi:2-polyprenyl-3-methyl-5-hydroxy-6-metoxy-1,4-benzoquinol methylase
MKVIRNCPSCNSDKQKTSLVCKDWLVSQEEFTIVECQSCKLKYTNPRPEDETLGHYYESSEYISHSNTKAGFISKIYQVVRNHTLRQKEKLLRKHVSRGTVLDYGCGTGHFLKYCNDTGWSVFGIEPDAKARASALSNKLIAYPNKASFTEKHEGQKFDAITLWHVLEHVTDLKETLEFFNLSLKGNGTLVIAVPNHRSYDASFYGQDWAAYDVPRHLYHFDITSLEFLLKQHGFILIKTKPMLFDSFYVSMLSEKNKKGKINYISAVLIGLISNLKAVFSSEYSSRIFIFKKQA